METQDVATYEVTTVAGGRFFINGRVSGESRFCGGVFLDDGFLRLLDSKVHTITGNPLAMERVGSGFIEDTLS